MISGIGPSHKTMAPGTGIPITQQTADSRSNNNNLCDKKITMTGSFASH